MYGSMHSETSPNISRTLERSGSKSQTPEGSPSTPNDMGRGNVVDEIDPNSTLKLPENCLNLKCTNKMNRGGGDVLEEKMKAVDLKTAVPDGEDEVPKHSEPVSSSDTLLDMDSMLKKCKVIASNKAFHSALISDEVMCPFLVLCLDSSSTDTVFRALDVFHLLALNPENRLGLSKVLHFFDALKAAASNKHLPKELRDFAILIYGTVKARNNPLRTQKGNSLNPQNQSQPHSKNVIDNKEKGAEQQQSHRNHSVCKGKATHLYIPQCIFKDKRLKMTEALLTLHGVISITYDMNKSYCVIRGKSNVPSDIFGMAIANLGFETHLITKTETGDEIMTLMSGDGKVESKNGIYEQENTPSPDYLSDTDSEKDMSMTQSVALKTDKDTKKESGWLSSATNFLQKSFYW